MNVEECETCSCLHVARIPGPAALSSFYESYGEFKGYSALESRSRRLRRFLRSWTDERLKIMLATGGMRQQRLLEIGPSYGEFLEMARRRGAFAAGVEIDAGARASLQAKGFDVFTEIPQGSTWDVICAFQVLEHLADPDELLGAVSSALAQDGRLMVTFPSGDDARHVGPNWLGYRVDLEHLNFFEVATLSRLLARHDLMIEHYWHTDQPAIARVEPPRRRSLPLSLAVRARRPGSGQRVMKAGSFVTTVVARRCEPHAHENDPGQR